MPNPLPFTRLMVSGEISSLRRLHGMLEHQEVNGRDLFTDMMKASFDHGRLDARALSDDLSYNFSSVHRWIDGKSAPHPSFWPNIVAWVMASLEAKIEAAEREMA